VTATNYYDQDTCEVSASVFTDGDVEPCGDHGECDDLECVCDTGYEGSWCCPITSNEDPEIVCGGEDNGVCAIAGVCDCETGFEGVYCCPKATGQVSACGDNGECTNTSVCVCDDFYIGDACQIDSRCPSDGSDTECSGQGTCTEMELTSCLTLGERFINNASVSFHIGGTLFTDEGRISLINRTLTLFQLGDNQDPALYTPFYSVCTTPSNRQLCINAVIGELLFSDLLYDTLTEENYPTDAIGSHPDGGVYTAVHRAVWSLLKLESEAVVNTILTTENECDDYYADPDLDENDDPDLSRNGCLRHFIEKAYDTTQGNSAYTRYPNSGSVNITVGATTIANEGAAHFIQFMARVFLDVEPDNRTLVNYYIANSPCSGSQADCLQNVITSILEGPEWEAIMATYAMDLDWYLNDTLARLLPDAIDPVSGVDVTAAAIILLSGEIEDKVELITQLSCYQWVSTTRGEYPAEFFTWPKRFCSCGTTSSGTTSDDYTLVPGSSTCELSCARGLDNLVCSGFSQGELRGTCLSDGEDGGHCVCEDGWGGTACNFPTSTYCYAWNQTIECGGILRGSCVQVEVGEPEFHCVCVTGWGGAYCEHAACPMIDDLVCSDEGVCEQHATDPAPRCHCFVSANLAESDDPEEPPLLPTGDDCSIDGIEECGVFFPDGDDETVGVWAECSLNGHCESNGTTVCVCTTGYWGPKCQFSDCPDVICPGDGRSFCNSSTADCECNLMWTTAEDCLDDSCVCGESLCEHGTPDVETGTECECDTSWEKPENETTCTIPICPLIMRITGGERLCTSNDPICEDDQDSLEDQCCYQVLLSM
jgi:hypothetical protein